MDLLAWVPKDTIDPEENHENEIRSFLSLLGSVYNFAILYFYFAGYRSWSLARPGSVASTPRIGERREYREERDC